MLIKWLGHSCFKIQVESQSVIIDPFAPGSVTGYRDINEKANIVLCSHLHGDHCGTSCVELVESPYASPFEVETMQSYHDNKQGKLRGENTIHILTVQDFYKVVHLGDLGHDLSDEQVAKIKDCHVLLIPVGGTYTINSKQAAELVVKINPKIVIPMHYRGEGYGFDVLEPVSNFTRYFENVLYLASDCLEVSDELDGEVVVLDYKL